MQKRAEPAAAAKAGTAPYVTPLVRKLAQEHGVDLDAVEGTGIGGRIRKQDVLAAAKGGTAESAQEAPAKAAAPTGGPSTAGVRPELAELRGTTKKANRIRKVTARLTRESLQSSAQLTQVFEVDMTRVAQLRAEVKEQFADKHGVKLTYLPFYAKAVVEALVSHPNVNASYDEDANEITYHEAVNLGIAVDTEAGLLSPVIKNAQDMDIPALAKAIIDLAERARASKLTPDDLSGGTFTITNIGSEGALFDTPILVPPQAAMLGTGAIVRRPVVDADDDGESIAIRSMGYTPLTYDHRLIDGADAGRFLTTVKDRLEKAEFEGDLGRSRRPGTGVLLTGRAPVVVSGVWTGRDVPPRGPTGALHTGRLPVRADAYSGGHVLQRSNPPPRSDPSGNPQTRHRRVLAHLGSAALARRGARRRNARRHDPAVGASGDLHGR